MWTVLSAFEWIIMLPSACSKNATGIRFGYLIGWFSLFNGISTFVGYLMPKPFS